MQERVAARIEMLQTQEARVATEYNILRKAIHDRNETIRSELTRFATPDHDPILHSSANEYLQK